MQPITIDIAGFVVTIKSEDAQMASRVRQRYGEFLATSGQTARVDITLNTIPGAMFVEPIPGPWVILTEYRDNRLQYRSYLEQGTVDFDNGVGHLDMAPNANIENFLRAIYAWLCVTNDALLLHAAGVIREGRGYVFFGPSGAGKTTTSRLASRSGHVVSDDLVVIRCGAEGCDLHGVPFKGELSEAPRANMSAPLQGLFRLRQDTEHYLEPISHVRAVADLVASSPFIVRDLALSDRLMAVCNRIASIVPVQQLHFKRDDGFWRIIDEHYEKVP